MNLYKLRPKIYFIFHSYAPCILPLGLTQSNHQNGKKIRHRCCHRHAVKPVHDPTMSGNQFAIILDVMVPLDGRCRQVTDHTHHRARRTDECDCPGDDLIRECRFHKEMCIQTTDQGCSGDTADTSLERLMRA